MQLTKTAINGGWEFKQRSSLNDSTASSFLPVAQFPTVAHIDLLHHKLISDPYIDDHELDCLWVNDADWTYRTSQVPHPEFQGPQTRAVLVFEGLDTVVDVFLNDTCILKSHNMLVQHRVDVTKLLMEAQGPISLELRFSNAPEFARREKTRIGYKGNDADIHFGGSERLFLRKAQYHWGWDWGPAINTCGPWKPIYLETFEQRIDDFLVRQETDSDLKRATLTIKGSVENCALNQKATVEIQDPSGSVVQTSSLDISEGKFNTSLVVENPQLWYPHQYGAQPLYQVTVKIPDYDSRSQSIGIRRLRLLQHSLKHAEGTSFVFEVNNIRLFAGGSCWIPNDFMLPRTTRQRYEDWLQLAKDGNQSMIRVWGGGIVESDDFYDICDRLGLLVWQDFLFACGNYPASQEFMDNVRMEAEQQLRRVGHHASLALWAGNNEDYMLAERFGWELDMKDEVGPWHETNFPAREIYERLLPSLVERLGGDVPYWRSSPYGGSFSNDTTVGDTHIWDVWHGKLSPYQDYKDYTSRFISEFGFESCPSLRTLHRAITSPSERHSLSRTFDIHDKGPGHGRRYPMYMGENFRFRMNPLRDFVYCTQYMQAEAMKYAYNCWRREFRGPEEENCAGVLVWQLNDIWPGSSWALVDVDMNRKPAYYITKRALAKIVVGMERTVTKKPPYITTGYLPEKASVDVWAVNGSLEALNATLKLRMFDIATGSTIELPNSCGNLKDGHKLELPPNQTTEIGNIDIPNPDQTVFAAYLEDRQGTVLARWVSWPEPLRLVHLARDLAVKISYESGEDGTSDKLLVSASAPVKGVMLSVPMTEEGDDAVFEDNFLDLVPGETVQVQVQGLNGRSVQSRFLYDWELEENFEL
ncbi:Beta-mannosidase [Trichoderma simmonsii]|uniref:Beta-mannosidase B n=1 Tax=Trichoderma simmonsii TaxID=1491479 RepID=A0A8G0L3T7_9HYPO|nr:Beta-mannosidase [Trichoderma simmonsii]